MHAFEILGTLNPFRLPSSWVDFVTKQLAATLAFYAAVGVLSAALVDVIKKLSPVRIRFNRQFLLNWFDERLRLATPTRSKRIFGLVRTPNNEQAGGQVAFTEAVRLATAGEEHALLDLTVEQLCGQLTAASQVTLQYPALYPRFYALLTSGATPADVALVHAGAPAATAPLETQAEYTSARTRVGSHAQRMLDALQILLGARWRWSLQVLSFAISVLIAIIALSLGYSTKDNTLGNVIQVVFIGVISGFIAPIAADLVAALQGLKKS